MRNLKLTFIFASLGFILSLICGFFSGSSFLRILITAIIWSVVFAGISLLINLVYSKFLVVEGEGDSEAGYSINISSAGNASPNTANLVVPDAELEQSGSDNHFDVGNNHQMLQEGDIYKPESSDNSQTESGFAPVRRAETMTNLSGTEAIPPEFSNTSSGKTGATKISNQSVANSIVDNDGSIDVLPDMGEVGFVNQLTGGSGISDDESSVSESEFVSSATNYRSSDASAGEVKDASLMAKAISSILSEEDS